MQAHPFALSEETKPSLHFGSVKIAMAHKKSSTAKAIHPIKVVEDLVCTNAEYERDKSTNERAQIVYLALYPGKLVIFVIHSTRALTHLNRGAQELDLAF